MDDKSGSFKSVMQRHATLKILTSRNTKNIEVTDEN